MSAVIRWRKFGEQPESVSYTHLDLTKNQAPSQIETPDNGENDVEIGLPKIVEKTEKPARRARIKV